MFAQILCAPGSTPAVERVFSVTDYTLNSKRMFLSDANFENQLFCNLNRNVNQARSNKLKVSGIGIGAIWNDRDRAQEK